MNNRPAYDALMKFYPLTLEDLPDELWKPIPDYPAYLVSNFGRVKSFKLGKKAILKPAITRNGYLRVDLCKGNKAKHFLIHRLVAKLFIANPDSKPQINHRDGHKLNNFVENLEWATSSENRQHAFDTGLQIAPQGEDNGQAKLTNEQARYIRENPDGLTINQLVQKFGVAQTNVSAIQLGKYYKVAGGIIRKARKRTTLTDELRDQIRAEYVYGSSEFGSYGLARKYGLCHRTILNIVNSSKS